MANSEHVKILSAGRLIWNQWRDDHPDVVPDLSGITLRSVDLGPDWENGVRARINLRGTNFQRTELRETILESADFRDSRLNGASFCGAALDDVDLTSADLQGVLVFKSSLVSTTVVNATLRDATVMHTQCVDVDFNKVDFRGASVGFTSFINCNLSDGTGLETCIHIGPSSLDYHTLTTGALPPTFLRGCGLPDSLIEHLPLLLNRAIPFHSCFISYSTANQDFSRQLHADLQNSGVPCWFAPHHIRGGKKIHEQIDEAIRTYDRLLLILSPESMNSEWVKTEISKARHKETTLKRRVLFPLALVPYDDIRNWSHFDADIGKDSAKEIREYYIPDFSRWKDRDSYTVAFERLLQDLRAEG